MHSYRRRLKIEHEKTGIPKVELNMGREVLLKLLAIHGAVLFEEFHTERSIASNLRELGEILLITPVKINKNPNAPTLYSHGRMRLHTDTPSADLVAWHCQEEGRSGEDTQFLDVKQLLDNYSDSMIELLEGVQCKVPDRANVPTRLHLAYEDYPIVKRCGDNILINYTPYLSFHCDNENQRRALDILLHDIEKLEKSSIKAIHLQKGQSLILDNRRFLHCRTNLDPNSQRCHYRYLISNPRAAII